MVMDRGPRNSRRWGLGRAREEGDRELQRNEIGRKRGGDEGRNPESRRLTRGGGFGTIILPHNRAPDEFQLRENRAFVSATDNFDGETTAT